MPLHLDYRPKTFKDFVGSENTVAALQSRIKDKSIPHAYLFVGESGCGKTTLGRILARKLGGLGKEENPLKAINYRELDSVNAGGVDTIRKLREQMRFAPAGKGKARVYLIDECHALQPKAQEDLLKALEDTPKHVFFILCTTNPEKMISTLDRRVTRYQVDPLSDDEMEAFLKKIAKKEDKKVPSPVIESIVDSSLGSPGRALNILDKVIGLPKKLMKKHVEEEAAKQNKVIDLCRALIDKKPWKSVSKILRDLKTEPPESIRRAVLGYCGSILLKSDNPRAYLIMDSFREPFYDTGFPKVILAAYDSLYAE